MIAAARIALVGLLVTAGLVFGVTSAGAAPNLVQNPSFTDDCSGVPCHWTLVTLPGAYSRDTATFRTAPASVSITVPTTNNANEVRSDCFSISPSTTYNIGGYYRNTSASTTSIRVDLIQYSDPGCGSFAGFGSASATPPNTTGVFTFLGAQTTTVASAQSASVNLHVQCAPALCTNTTVNFDDVGVSTGPLAVTVVSFSAHRAGKGVLLRWRTGTEANELGFNVYRQQGARRVRVNRRLLPALGGIGGSSYSYRDRRAPRHRAVRYWLQDVAVDGTRTWHGPVRVSGA